MEDDIELEDESSQKHYNNHPWRKIFKTVFKRKKYAIGLIISVALLALLDTLFTFINNCQGVLQLEAPFFLHILYIFFLTLQPPCSF